MQIELRRSILSGRLKAKPSRAYAHRALMLAALSPGQTVVSNLPQCGEIGVTIAACRELGADIVTEGDVADIFVSPEEMHAPLGISCQESNTTLKLFMPICSLFESEVEFSASGRLKEEMIGFFLSYLERLGAKAEYKGKEGLPPFTVKGPMQESELAYFPRLGTQFLSGILLAAPLRGQDTSIALSGHMSGWPYIEETLSLMELCGAEPYASEEGLLAFEGGQFYSAPKEIAVKGSFMLPSYAALAGALCGKVEIEGMAKSPKLESLLKSFGASAQSSDAGFVSVAEPLSTPGDIDALALGPYLLHAMVLAASTVGQTNITNMASLEHRQRLRVIMMSEELAKMGARLESTDDGLVISGTLLNGAELDSRQDPCIAMALSAAALGARGLSKLLWAECVEPHYPGFFDELASLGAIKREAL